MKNSKNNKHINTQKGAIAIYITLLMVLMITSAAIVLSSVLSRQIQLSRTIIASEQAFYGANSGVEHTLYYLARQIVSGTATDEIQTFEGEITYDDAPTVSYSVKAKAIYEAPYTEGTVCISSAGDQKNQKRRIILQPAGVDCEL